MREITKEDIAALRLDPNSRKLCWRDGHQPPPSFVAYVPESPDPSERLIVVSIERGIYSGYANGRSVGFGDGPMDVLIATPTWPELGHGQQWHNPENLTPEQVGEGWRPLVVGEQIHEGCECKPMWDRTSWHPGLDTHFKAGVWSPITYRTRAPLPAAKQRVKLGPGDLPGGCVWVRINGNSDIWIVTGVSTNGVYYGTVFTSWTTLLGSQLQWSTDRNATDWKPFWKEV